ncbi:MAG: hypothetical protein J6K16_03140 [Alphaproteobacteria bacterium]|nr:hypothetical protein [Alphaproteobacteria bacterium]
MVQKTFEEYKQEMRDYYALSEKERCGKLAVGEKTISDMNIQEITDGLYTTFPKKPTLGDKMAKCYAYWYLSALPMSEVYYHDWRKQIKSCVNELPENNPDNDGKLFFLLCSLPRAKGNSGEAFKYAEKIAKKLTKKNQTNPRVQQIVGELARPYFNELLENAGKSENFENYQQQIKAFDKIIPVMLKLPEGSRYNASQDLLKKMYPVYQQSEWGRNEFGYKHKSIRHRVYASMSETTKLHMRNQKAKKDWLYK